jgi:Xaa-Pro aminopeptidase
MDRTAKIKLLFPKLNIDAFLFTNLFNIRYLTGFSGSSGYVLITKDKSYFITDYRYKIQSHEEVNPDFEIIIFNQNSFDFLKDIIEKNNIHSIAFESSTMPYDEAVKIKEKFSNVNFVPAQNESDDIFSVKTEKELDALRRAVEITDIAFADVLKMIKPGLKETDIAAEITYLQMKMGAERNAFDPIVACGPRSAYPHARATDSIIKTGQLLKLDFGCVVDGMNSDMTRTIAIGNVSDEIKHLYAIVKEAQEIALSKVTAGESTKAIDASARDFIASKGYGENFGHGLGHALGLDVHEKPSLNQRTDHTLQVNNVITIEPGIYIQGLGGIRIEDDVIVKEHGCEVLNKTTKDLITISY